MSDQPEINLLDDEYMTPQDADALRKTLEVKPQPATTPVLDPADVAEHRRRNNTEGQESEE